MKILVAVGCSHTHGSMIDGVNGSSHYGVRNGFPGMIAKENGYELINISKPGGSNQYIHRMTCKYLNYHLNPKAEYLFLLGWTSVDRIELRYEDSTTYKHITRGDHIDYKNVPFTANSDKKVFHSPEIKEMLDYTPLLFSSTQLIDSWASYVIALQNIFKHKGINYYMHNTCMELRKTKNNITLLENIDLTRYYSPFKEQDSLVHHNLRKDLFMTPCWHFREDGHREWASVLSSNMKTQGVL